MLQKLDTPRCEHKMESIFIPSALRNIIMDNGVEENYKNLYNDILIK